MTTKQTTKTSTTTSPYSGQTSSAQAPLQERVQVAAESALDDGVKYVRKCVRENPEAAALWCLGIGFVLGWKLKPW